MGERLKDKGAVVTGAGRGIGREVALALAAAGARVVVVDPGASRAGEGFEKGPADETVAEIKKRGGTAVASYNSVTDFDSAHGIIQTCVDNFGRLDILVNCAGILREKMVWNMAAEDWDAVIKVHLYGTFNCSRWAAGVMREQRRGRIINFTSTAWIGAVGQSNYAAAKGGIVSFTRGIARELGGYGITCNIISPLAATRMILDEGVKIGMKKRLDTGVITKAQYDAIMSTPGPEFIPPMVVYLASDDAWNINGKIFHVEKGKVALFSEPEQFKQVFTYKENWTADDLAEIVPKTLLVGYVNPRPPDKPPEKG